ncbi:MAG: dihydrofolate reductase [Alphaproteobacteria bacterium]|nr:dihydrofolate reductase [Alphaproteobacteria bacterium]
MALATPEIVLILARAHNGVIGKDNRLPWRIPEDMQRFKALTLGKPVIMGRKTWDSLPRKPLPGRTNIVLSRSLVPTVGGVVVADSPAQALSLARVEHPAEIAVIGGAEVYAAFLPWANRIELTEIDADIAGDTVLPDFPQGQWREAARTQHVSPDGLAYAFVTLVRTVTSPCLQPPAD